MPFCQCTMVQCPMALELPATPDAAGLAVAAVAVDEQAARGEAPNNQLPVSIIFLLTPCIGVRGYPYRAGFLTGRAP